MAKVADCVTPTDAGGTNPVLDSTALPVGISYEVLGAFSVEGTKKEPTEGQIWPRLA
jgi:hypothetical protein